MLYPERKLLLRRDVRNEHDGGVTTVDTVATAQTVSLPIFCFFSNLFPPPPPRRPSCLCSYPFGCTAIRRFVYFFLRCVRIPKTKPKPFFLFLLPDRIFVFVHTATKKKKSNQLSLSNCMRFRLLVPTNARTMLSACTNRDRTRPPKTDSTSIHSNVLSVCVASPFKQNEHKKICKNEMNRNQGAHSPDMRVLSMGVYPIQRVNSQVVGQDDVSKRLNGVHPPHFTTTKQTNNNSHLAPIARIEFFLCIRRFDLQTLPPRTRTYFRLDGKPTPKIYTNTPNTPPPSHAHPHYHQSYT